MSSLICYCFRSYCCLHLLHWFPTPHTVWGLLPVSFLVAQIIPNNSSSLETLSLQLGSLFRAQIERIQGQGQAKRQRGQAKRAKRHGPATRSQSGSRDFRQRDADQDNDLGWPESFSSHPGILGCEVLGCSEVCVILANISPAQVPIALETTLEPEADLQLWPHLCSAQPLQIGSSNLCRRKPEL